MVRGDGQVGAIELMLAGTRAALMFYKQVHPSPQHIKAANVTDIAGCSVVCSGHVDLPFLSAMWRNGVWLGQKPALGLQEVQGSQEHRALEGLGSFSLACADQTLLSAGVSLGRLKSSCPLCSQHWLSVHPFSFSHVTLCMDT